MTPPTPSENVRRYLEEEGNLLNPLFKGKVPKNNKIIAGWNKGIPTEKSVKIKLSIAHKGKTGERASHWKGDGVKYPGLHHWIADVFGRKNKCELCKTTIAKRFEWANKDHKYRRKREDWMRVCTRCHGQYDQKNKLRIQGKYPYVSYTI